MGITDSKAFLNSLLADPLDPELTRQFGVEVVPETTAREQVHPTGRPNAPACGFVEQMPGGHWRAYRYDSGIGYGPLPDREAAVRWVRTFEKPSAPEAPAPGSAAEAYGRHQGAARALLADISGRLIVHAAKASRFPENWGFVGDLGSTVERLTEIRDSFGPAPKVEPSYAVERREAGAYSQAGTYDNLREALIDCTARNLILGEAEPGLSTDHRWAVHPTPTFEEFADAGGIDMEAVAHFLTVLGLTQDEADRLVA